MNDVFLHALPYLRLPIVLPPKVTVNRTFLQAKLEDDEESEPLEMWKMQKRTSLLLRLHIRIFIYIYKTLVKNY